MDTQSTTSGKGFVAAIIGTILVALCCFTPVLVVVLGAVGLGVLTQYLDYLLLPALVVMVTVTVMAYRKWKRSTQPPVSP